MPPEPHYCNPEFGCDCAQVIADLRAEVERLRMFELAHSTRKRHVLTTNNSNDAEFIR